MHTDFIKISVTILPDFCFVLHLNNTNWQQDGPANVLSDDGCECIISRPFSAVQDMGEDV